MVTKRSNQSTRTWWLDLEATSLINVKQTQFYFWSKSILNWSYLLDSYRIQSTNFKSRRFIWVHIFLLASTIDLNASINTNLLFTFETMDETIWINSFFILNPTIFESLLFFFWRLNDWSNDCHQSFEFIIYHLIVIVYCLGCF